MKYREFVRNAVVSLNDDCFDSLKTMLTDKYLGLFIIEKNTITREILAEKICDYLEKVELKNYLPFDRQIEKYVDTLDSLVANKIAKTPKARRHDVAPSVPRARRYYEKVQIVKKKRLSDWGSILDYSRIMMCLYSAIIRNNREEIYDFDYSTKCLTIRDIVIEMETEKIGLSKNRKIANEGVFTPEASVFVISIIMLHKIINDKAQGDYFNE